MVVVSVHNQTISKHGWIYWWNLVIRKYFVLSIDNFMKIFILIYVVMNNCNWFLKKSLTNICRQTYWLILPIKLKLIIPLAIFLCHWWFHRQNTDDIFYWWFCRGGSKQFITLCNYLMKMLIIYRHNIFRSINKLFGKNAIKQFLNGIKQHQTINLNWRKKQLQMSIKIN